MDDLISRWDEDRRHQPGSTRLGARAPGGRPTERAVAAQPSRRGLAEVHRVDARRVDARFQDADLVNALRLLAREAGVQLVIDQGVAGTVTVSLQRVDPYEALVALASANGATVQSEGTTVMVRPDR